MDFVDRRLPFFDGTEMVIEDREVDRLEHLLIRACSQSLKTQVPSKRHICMAN
jgi:hypothetical protein